MTAHKGLDAQDDLPPLEGIDAMFFDEFGQNTGASLN